MANCGALQIGSFRICGTTLQGGIGGDSRLILFNYADVTVTESGSTPNLITAITLASGASGYVFEGYKVSLKPSVDAVDSASSQTLWKHRANFLIFENTQLQKNNIDTMKNGRYIALIENNGKNSDSFELYGLGSGLVMKPQKVRDLQENSSAYNLLLETLDNELEIELPATFLATSYSGTVTAIAALLFLPTITVISDLAISTAGGDAETITGTNFYGSGSQPDVSSVQWKNRATGALTTQTSVTVASATSITFSSVALAAGTYNLRVTTSKGYVDSTIIVTVS